MTDKLIGKVAVITGGTSGIGLASVKLFVAEGAKVVVGDISDDLGAALEAEYNGEVKFVHADVTSESDIEGLVTAAVETYGKLDVFYNNAAAPGDTSLMIDMTAAGFDRTLALIARSVLLGHKYAAKQFQKQGTGGAIVTTASAASLQAGWSAGGYTIAKHAVVGIIRESVIELSALGIRSNAIAPGLIMTPAMASAFGIPQEQSPEFLKVLAKHLDVTQPIGRVGQPEDIAEAAVFLASDSSSFITGVVLPVDGGATAVTQSPFGPAGAQAVAAFAAGER
ncbi:SDR family NAD(P)-dependent oxidoreductase [Subtercola endophyticus]|uniref:SDR family NAD(P)-dependent oxidoreductase n=1 Tax=Subtercola endophyticus TaxID=2895559 RepID=UPI001E3AE078|nr:SDR family oxidoreductase [Subtercola endophyticus]UFS60664.1 SDR family oxidoreductase [Subtercola endophyticus]